MQCIPKDKFPSIDLNNLRFEGRLAYGFVLIAAT
jgi:hypothetical protein